jgi:hypothetical protein
MPALKVLVDAQPVETVSTDGTDILCVHLSGSVVDEQFAAVRCDGGAFPAEGESTYLIWISERSLTSGQVVTVEMIERGTSSHPGRTVDELFPDSSPTEKGAATNSQQVLAELRSRRRTREQYRLYFESSHGTRYAGTTGPDELGFGFLVMWTSDHPKQAKVSLHTYTLDDLQRRTPVFHVQEYLDVGGHVQFKVVA